MAQLGSFKTLNAVGESIWMQGASLNTMLGLVVLTMLIIWLLPKMTKVIPSSLAAIVVVFGIVKIAGLDTTSVGDIAEIGGGFPPFHIPVVPYTLKTLLIIAPYSFIVAAVGLVESLLTLNLIDEITETRGSGKKERCERGDGRLGRHERGHRSSARRQFVL